jgi:signal transduction histidine kinase
MTVYEHNSRKSLIAPMDFTFLLEEMIEDAREDEVEEIDELLRDDFTFRFYNWSRIVVGIVPYIAFGDRSGLVGIEEGSVQEYLKLTENMFPTPNVTIDKPEIKSDEFWIMKQLYKNAGEATNRKFRYEYGVENDFPERSVSVGIADDVLYVEDNGDGIPAEVLNSIFGIYTSSGAGLGLQMVKRIVDLRNGHIVVTSTQEGEDTFQYDTRTDQVTELDEAKPRGTKFEVYFGKEE